MTSSSSVVRLFSSLFLLCNTGGVVAFIAPNRQTRNGAGTRLFLDGEGMANGLFNRHMLGDAIRALQPRNLNQAIEAVKGNMKGARVIETGDFVDGAPSWEELSKMLKTQQTKEEQSFREMLSQGKVHSPLASIRLFGSDTVPRVKFYRDSASWCPYCQKVWIALEEKMVSYEVVKVDMNCYTGSSKSSEFLKVQPNGNLPCAVIDGEIIGESDLIIDRLDEMSSVGPKLRPKGQEDRIKFLCDDGKYDSLERKLYSEWMWYLTGKRRPVEYRERFEAQLDAIELALGETSGPYFLGRDLSLVDIKFIPFVERQAASLAYFKGFEVRDASRWPNLVKWLEAMESRPTYQVTKSDYYTHSRSLPPQLAASCTFAPDEGDYETLRSAIDAYSLPTTSPLDQQALDWEEPGWNSRQDPARREAAERIIHNAPNIVSFACRAAGTPGFPAAGAPLADPLATINQDAKPVVDVFLRHVVLALLSPGQDDQKTKAAATAKAFSNNPETVEAVVDCLDYLRMRVGVPRDMQYPAAREIKFELLQLARHLLDESMYQNSTTDARNTIRA